MSVQLYNMFSIHDSSGMCWHVVSDIPKAGGGYDDFKKYCGEDFTTMSYSPLGILLSLTVAVVLTAAIFVLGRKKLSPMPVVGSCSASIAASCHASAFEQAAWEKPLKWGVIPEPEQGSQGQLTISHCGLSSHCVEQPTEGTLYT